MALRALVGVLWGAALLACACASPQPPLSLEASLGLRWVVLRDGLGGAIRARVALLDVFTDNVAPTPVRLLSHRVAAPSRSAMDLDGDAPLAWAQSSTASLVSDRLAALGFVRLLCDGRLVESHPFPFPMSSPSAALPPINLLEPPTFLLPLIPGAAAWHPLLEALQRGGVDDLGLHTADLSFVLVLDWLISSAGTAADQPVRPQRIVLSESELLSASTCKLSFLPPEKQNIQPVGAFLLRSSPLVGDFVFEMSSSVGAPSTPAFALSASKWVPASTSSHALAQLPPLEAQLHVPATSEQRIDHDLEPAALSISSLAHAHSRGHERTEQLDCFWRPRLARAQVQASAPSRQRAGQRLEEEFGNGMHVAPLLLTELRYLDYVVCQVPESPEANATSKHADDTVWAEFLELESAQQQRQRLTQHDMMQARIKLYQRVMNPVASAFEPVGKSIPQIISDPVAGILDAAMLHKMESGISKSLIQDVMQRVIPTVASNLPSNLAETVPTQLTSSVPQAISKRLVPPATRDIANWITQEVAFSVAENVPQQVESQIPRNLIPGLGPELGSVLGRSLTNSIVPALKRTLMTSARSVRCWYCDYNKNNGNAELDKKMCSGCTGHDEQGNIQRIQQGEDQEVQNALYYAAYYSKYYAGYYGEMDYLALDLSIQDSQPTTDFTSGVPRPDVPPSVTMTERAQPNVGYNKLKPSLQAPVAQG